jgi:hypothetical protein
MKEEEGDGNKTVLTFFVTLHQKKKKKASKTL